MYAMGVIECDNMLMLLGVSSKFSDTERDVVIPLMIRGFKVYFVVYFEGKDVTLFTFLGLC